MSYQLAIFDLDGTVLNTLDDLADSMNYALSAFGFPERTVDEIRRFVGNGIRKLVERALPDGCDEETVGRVFECFKAYYKDHCAIKTAPYDGILPLLADLKRSGMKLAVLSNKADFAVQSLCKRYFDGMFDLAVGERAGVRRKPAPDAVEEVLARLHTEPSCALYIGDSEVDVETAKNAAIDCVAVDWGFRDRASLSACGAEKIVSTPEALKAVLLG